MNEKNFRNQVKKAIFSPEYHDCSYIDNYLKPHEFRFVETASLLRQVIKKSSRVIDLGTYGSLVPILKDVFDVFEIICTAPPKDGVPATEWVGLANADKGFKYQFHQDRFHLEDQFPYEDEIFDVVIFTEVLEHLTVDPMSTMAEINRVTKTGGYLLLSTPNCASSLSLSKILRGENPFLFPVYIKNRSSDRHNREYTYSEIKQLMEVMGYKSIELKTMNIYSASIKKKILLRCLELLLLLLSILSFGLVKRTHRGDSIFVLAQKVSNIKSRHPDFLYYP